LIDFPGVLTQPESQLRMLSSIGWLTPSVNWTYDFTLSTTEKHRYPEPSKKMLLILTKRQYVLTPKKESFKGLKYLAQQTQLFLNKFNIDWCVISLSFEENKLIAYGMQAELPENLNPTLAGQIINDAITVNN
jgi:hypothetical protein